MYERQATAEYKYYFQLASSKNSLYTLFVACSIAKNNREQAKPDLHSSTIYIMNHQDQKMYTSHLPGKGEMAAYFADVPCTERETESPDPLIANEQVSCTSVKTAKPTYLHF